MPDNWNQAEYREWKEGHWEKLLPLAWDNFDQDARLKRVERLARHIQAGADRTVCRCFVYTEEEWGSGCRKAGREPGEGWVTLPQGKPNAHVHKVEFVHEPEPQPVADVLDRWWDA
jgi:hypothetical protein